MKRTKKLLAFLLAFALVFGSLPSGMVTVSAEGEATGADVEKTEESEEEITADSVQALINALPDANEITAENAEEVEAALDAIDEARSALYKAGGNPDELDYTKYDAACEALAALEGEESGEPVTVDAEDGATEQADGHVASVTTGETTKYYTTLSAAVSAAAEGSTITLLCDTEVGTQIEINKSLTLDLKGQTLTNNVENNRLFKVSAAVTFTIDGTVEGSAMVIPESNTTSYGFIEINAAATVTLNGGTYSGNTDNGSFIESSYYDESSVTTVNLIDVTATTNNRFFVADGDKGVYTLNLTVSGGTYTGKGEDKKVCFILTLMETVSGHLPMLQSKIKIMTVYGLKEV